MLWLFEKHMSITGLMRRLSLIGINDIWQFGVFVYEDHSKFIRYTGYINFINDPISHVLLLILVHVVYSFDVLLHCA